MLVMPQLCKTGHCGHWGKQTEKDRPEAVFRFRVSDGSTIVIYTDPAERVEQGCREITRKLHELDRGDRRPPGQSSIRVAIWSTIFLRSAVSQGCERFAQRKL